MYLNDAKKKYSSDKNKCFDYICKAFYYFGMSLHPRQDMISHSGKGGNLYYSNNVNYANGTAIPVFYYHLPGYDNPNWKYLNSTYTKGEMFYIATENLIKDFLKTVIEKGF